MNVFSEWVCEKVEINKKNEYAKTTHILHAYKTFLQSFSWHSPPLQKFGKPFTSQQNNCRSFSLPSWMKVKIRQRLNGV